jgi:hypothetical protein
MIYTLCPPICDESRQAQRCERDKASPRLKLARFGKMRGRTRGGSVSVTIAQRHDPLARHPDDLTAEFAASLLRAGFWPLADVFDDAA